MYKFMGPGKGKVRIFRLAGFVRLFFLIRFIARAANGELSIAAVAQW